LLNKNPRVSNLPPFLGKIRGGAAGTFLAIFLKFMGKKSLGEEVYIEQEKVPNFQFEKSVPIFESKKIYKKSFKHSQLLITL